MIVRIVKMTFKPETVNQFLAVFENSKEKIRAFECCEHLKLLQEKKEGNIFFTYSYWQSETHLNNYRHSELFKDTWAKTKVLFADKPEAWSLNKLHQLD